MSLPETSTGPGRRELVLLISCIMMTVAFAIDSMLPALPDIAHSLGVSHENDRQLVITAFFVGFGIMQLVVGTLSDAWGRRNLMLYGLFAYGLTSLAAALAPTFEHLLFARAVQGMAAAVGQVVLRSAVRDLFEGRDMAQVMSLASTLFMMAPILAPAMGQLVLGFGPWPWIFGALAMIGFAVWLWVLLRLPETLPLERRVPVDRKQIIHAARVVLTDRMSLGYGLAMAMLSSALNGFLLSIQQIFEHVFKAADALPAGFALMAAGMAIASLVNALIVKRYGMRLIGHAALLFFTLMAGVHLLLSLQGSESMTSFILLQTLMMMGFSFTAGNFGAMAMENMGSVAGMASSLQGSMGILLGIIFGTLIGRSFDGTTVPLYTGYFISGLAALAFVFWTEGGRLFVARHAPVKE